MSLRVRLGGSSSSTIRCDVRACTHVSSAGLYGQPPRPRIAPPMVSRKGTSCESERATELGASACRVSQSMASSAIISTSAACFIFFALLPRLGARASSASSSSASASASSASSASASLRDVPVFDRRRPRLEAARPWATSSAAMSAAEEPSCISNLLPRPRLRAWSSALLPARVFSSSPELTLDAAAVEARRERGASFAFAADCSAALLASTAGVRLAEREGREVHDAGAAAGVSAAIEARRLRDRAPRFMAATSAGVPPTISRSASSSISCSASPASTSASSSSSSSSSVTTACSGASSSSSFSSSSTPASSSTSFSAPATPGSASATRETIGGGSQALAKRSSILVFADLHISSHIAETVNMPRPRASW
mmetsp:Transcript_8945/g.23402  ORF Transcript_8945/g.23402 Transcript_8945/m.23402 type:complete len:372 (-) Transcript_8945:316-1431(-)